MGHLSKDYYFYRDQFDAYCKALDTSEELPKTVSIDKTKYEREGKDVKVSKAASELIKAYYHISRYEKLQGSKASKALEDLLANKNFSKKFPKKILLFKLEKLLIDVYNKRTSRGRLQHPKSITPEATIPTDKLLAKLGVSSPDFKFQRNQFSLIGSVGQTSDILRLAIATDQKIFNFKVSADNADVLIRQVETNELLFRLPLEDVSVEVLLDKVETRLIQGENYPANEILLDKMGILKAPFQTVFKGVEYHIEKFEENSDCLILTAQQEGKEGSFLLKSENDSVVLRKFTNGQAGRVVYAFDAQEITLEKLLNRTASHLGFTSTSSKELRENLRDMRDSRLARALGSIEITRPKVLQTAIAMNLNPGKRVADYPEATIQSFLSQCGAKEVTYHPSMSISHLIKAVTRSKGWIGSEMGFKAMHFFLERLPQTTRLKKSDEQFLETYKNRVNEQLAFRETEFEKLWDHPVQAPQLSAQLATEFLHKASSPEYSEIGPFISAGWVSSKGGHFINVELLKKGDIWQFRVANAGSGVRFHRKQIGRRSSSFATIKVYETKDSSEAEKIVADLLLFGAQRQNMEAQAKVFYSIFKNAEHIEDYAIPPRKIQKASNCVVRSQEETFFDVCQRQNRIKLANNYLSVKAKNIEIASDQYPLLRQEFMRSSPKEPIYRKFKSDKSVTLVEGKVVDGKVIKNPKEKHKLPLTYEKDSFTIGLNGNIVHTDIKKTDAKKVGPEGVQKKTREVVLRSNGKYLYLHPSRYNKDDLKIYREGQLLGGSSIQLKTNDTIVMGNQTFTVE